MECFNCSVSGDKVKLFDAISETGIVKICEKCSVDERLPIVRKPTVFQLEESEKKYSVYERLSRNAGRGLKEDKPIKKELEEMKKTLREVSNKNYEQKIQTNPKLMPGLVDNFHWIIMRVRRLKKLTQEQLAKEISEPEASIKMAEKGILSEGNYELVKKLEIYLGIKLLKEEFQNKRMEHPKIPEEQTKKSEFDLKELDLKNVENLTIADLKKMKEEKEAKILGSFEE